MSKQHEALKLALEALEAMQSYAAAERKGLRICDEAITAIREALAEQPEQPCGYPYCGCNSKAWCKLERMAENARELGLDYEPARQEPVAWRYNGNLHEFDPSDWATGPVTPLYISPQAREPLTDDTKRLDALLKESWDLRCFDMPTGQGDADIGWRVIEHYMAEPNERVIAEVYCDDPRQAIDRAIEAAHGIKGEKK